MISRTSIVRTVSSGLIVITLGAGLLGGAGVAHGQPIGGSSSRTCPALRSPTGLMTDDPPVQMDEGSVMPDMSGRKHICIAGKWVSCTDPSLSPSQLAACGTGLISGGSFQINQTFRTTTATSTLSR